jgi:hypothetical protein
MLRGLYLSQIPTKTNLGAKQIRCGLEIARLFPIRLKHPREAPRSRQFSRRREPANLPNTQSGDRGSLS